VLSCTARQEQQRLDMKIKKAICHSGNPAGIIRNPVKLSAYGYRITAMRFPA